MKCLVHGPLVKGLGLFSDAILCLSCGLEKYEEYWSWLERASAAEVSPELWPAIAKARKLPAGVDFERSRV